MFVRCNNTHSLEQIEFISLFLREKVSVRECVHNVRRCAAMNDDCVLENTLLSKIIHIKMDERRG